MIEFDEKYDKANEELRKNLELVNSSFAISQEKGLIDDLKKTEKYFSVGQVNNLYVGIDLSLKHNILFFPGILANMRLVYEVSNGEADLSKVYASLNNQQGILSEDMTFGGRYRIIPPDKSFREGNSVYSSYPLNDNNRQILNEIFEDIHEQFLHAVFHVVDKDGYTIRQSIADLDHLGKVKEKYRDTRRKYIEQYKHDNRFIIVKD